MIPNSVGPIRNPRRYPGVRGAAASSWGEIPQAEVHPFVSPWLVVISTQLGTGKLCEEWLCWLVDIEWYWLIVVLVDSGIGWYWLIVIDIGWYWLIVVVVGECWPHWAQFHMFHADPSWETGERCEAVLCHISLFSENFMIFILIVVWFVLQFYCFSTYFLADITLRLRVL